MGSRAEVHFHLLPGVDDGPESIEESIGLARAAVTEGTGTIVATPHVRGDFVTDVRDLPDRVQEVRDRLAREKVQVTALCGAELGADMVGRLGQADLETVAVGPPGARWLLLETPFGGLDEHLHVVAEELRDRGFGVVLGHPERSADALAGDDAGLELERARGTALQVNASSLSGDHGPAVQAAALRLMAAGLVEAIASDAHSEARGPALERGLRTALDHGIPKPVARRAADFGPARLVTRGLVTPVAAVLA